MNPFVAWAVSWQGTAALMACALACGMILGWLACAQWQDRADRRRAEERAEEREARRLRRWYAQLADREPDIWGPNTAAFLHPEVHHQDPRVAHEAWVAHSEQALALVRDDLTDSAYTADMAARMDRFLEGLCGVPYSADELWSGQ